MDGHYDGELSPYAKSQGYERGAKPVETGEDFRSLEELGNELEALNEGINELVSRRNVIRREVDKRIKIAHENIARADDRFYNIIQGPSEGIAVTDEPRRY